MGINGDLGIIFGLVPGAKFGEFTIGDRTEAPEPKIDRDVLYAM